MTAALLPYIEFAKVAFSREATYRFEVFTSIGSLLVRVYLFRMVWSALYFHNAGIRALTLREAITYSTVALLMSLVMDIDQTRLLVSKLEDGSIATDFMKPINVPLYFFSDGTGEVGFHALTIIPSLLLALLSFTSRYRPLVLFVFFLSFFLGYLVGLLMNFVLNCIAFWTLEIQAMQLIVTWITDLLGGEVIPLVFFPPMSQSFIYVLPFAAMYSTPLLIYVGTSDRKITCARCSCKSSGSSSSDRRGSCGASARAASWCRADEYARDLGRRLQPVLAHQFSDSARIPREFSGVVRIHVHLSRDGACGAMDRVARVSGDERLDVSEMAFLYSLWMMAHALNNTLFLTVGDVPEHVREGEIDRSSSGR